MSFHFQRFAFLTFQPCGDGFDLRHFTGFDDEFVEVEVNRLSAKRVSILFPVKMPCSEGRIRVDCDCGRRFICNLTATFRPARSRSLHTAWPRKRRGATWILLATDRTACEH